MKISNPLGLSMGWVNAAMHDDYDQCGDISVTSLESPPRVYQLLKRHDHEITETVQQRIWMILGQAVHYILEKGADANSITEERLVMEFEGVEVSLKPDRVEPMDNDEWHLKDFKITTVWSVIYPLKKEWKGQFNMYAYFLRKLGINVTRISAELALKDWKESDYQQNKDTYPPEDMHIRNVPVWSDEECEEYLRARIKAHWDAKDLPDDELPECSFEERWARDAKYAVINPTTAGNKGKDLKFCKASKNCEHKQEAEDYIATKKNKDVLVIQYREGISMRCEKYCSAKPFCNQYQTKIKKGA